MGARYDFYPRSPRGERHVRDWCAYSERYFYPRSPRGERPIAADRGVLWPAFLSTLPARGATHPGLGIVEANEQISIHAPREGSDKGRALRAARKLQISIHAPREGSDHPDAPGQ